MDLAACKFAFGDGRDARNGLRRRALLRSFFIDSGQTARTRAMSSSDDVVVVPKGFFKQVSRGLSGSNYGRKAVVEKPLQAHSAPISPSEPLTSPVWPACYLAGSSIAAARRPAA